MVLSDEMKRIICYGGLAGVFGGCSVLLGKSTAELVKNVIQGEDDGAFKHLAPYLIVGGMLVSLLMQITILNKGLEKFNALLMVPVYQSFWNISSVLNGIIYFQEYRDLSGLQALFFVFGILVTLWGVANLLRERLVRDELSPSSRRARGESSAGEGGAASADGEDDDERDGREECTDKDGLLVGSRNSSSGGAFGSGKKGRFLGAMIELKAVDGGGKESPMRY